MTMFSMSSTHFLVNDKCMLVCMHTCMYLCVSACMHAYMCIYVYRNMDLYKYSITGFIFLPHLINHSTLPQFLHIPYGL